MMSMEKLDEPTLPDISKFESSLTGEGISQEDYDHANRVWEAFEISNLGAYAKLYMETDVRLLADVFEKFQSVCVDMYSLDPAFYYTAPGLAWDTMIKCTGVNIKLLMNVDMLLFFERGICGGLCQCVHRHAKADNPRLHEESDDSSYIMYFDVMNLYEFAMQQCLHIGGFRWLNPKQIDGFRTNLLTLADDSKVGYVCEVDLTYPQHLHDEHSDLPLCPQHQVPGIKSSSVPKLLTTLVWKERYVIHYDNLKQCLNLGMQLDKVHRVIAFKQRPWLKPCNDLNTKKRVSTQSAFESDFYKLMINAIFGKTIEDIRKHRKIYLVNHWDGRFGARYYIAMPNFKRATEFNEEFVAVEMAKVAIRFTKPVFFGMCVLDLSKLHMYRFHYEFASPEFKNPKLPVLYMDTDSFIYWITNCDPYAVIRCHADKFDTSGYATDNPYGITPDNEKIIGLMKDETNGSQIEEFVGLRSKMYAYRTVTGQPKAG